MRRWTHSSVRYTGCRPVLSPRASGLPVYERSDQQRRPGFTTALRPWGSWNPLRLHGAPEGWALLQLRSLCPAWTEGHKGLCLPWSTLARP